MSNATSNAAPPAPAPASQPRPAGLGGGGLPARAPDGAVPPRPRPPAGRSELREPALALLAAAFECAPPRHHVLIVAFAAVLLAALTVLAGAVGLLAPPFVMSRAWNEVAAGLLGLPRAGVWTCAALFYGGRAGARLTGIAGPQAACAGRAAMRERVADALWRALALPELARHAA
jgi:hypothetical protein